ncbi:hypothetical protein RFI_40176 [Reticulomyxa filosa]|uniref:Uncharacterized protein n=1 Tax=Reticulomyxa filosa TaxID=46433 RepID=X6L7L4_RETFI|nr:hypothetical protein RFI_40176 [Reticulomyxa filosa]|eukprot:ETN97355.1 hypothetical protein RFI_40176 [Reticulomyxa filosa]
MEGLYTKWLELVNIKYMQFCKQRQEKLSKWKSKSEESEDMYLNMSLTLASNAIESFNRLKDSMAMFGELVGIYELHSLR